MPNNLKSESKLLSDKLLKLIQTQKELQELYENIEKHFQERYPNEQTVGGKKPKKPKRATKIKRIKNKRIRKLYKGPRGGTYYKSKGRKIYVR